MSIGAVSSSSVNLRRATLEMEFMNAKQIMNRIIFLAILIIFSFSTLVAPARIEQREEDGPDPGQVQLLDIKYNGSGCRPHTVTPIWSPNPPEFILYFDEFIAQYGPNVNATENRKFCQVSIDLRVPDGWQYSIPGAVKRGYVRMDTGVKALSSSIYYFSGNAPQITTESEFDGPYNESYLSRDRFSSDNWSPCNQTRNLNINANIRIIAESNARGYISIDSLSDKFKQSNGLQWRRC
ncbi:uncharacterized protein VTP21DRAFT_8840 [Calcarisporiella thermophila]|uniref:uncharacterized protein n=1 Tax=Calcarisporiella thermophila TaxID=911321 RepID=UPI00374382E2